MIRYMLKDPCRTSIKCFVMSLAICRILAASLIPAFLLFWPLLSSGQNIPQPATRKAIVPESLSLTGQLRTDEEIDKEVNRITAQVDRLRAENVDLWREGTEEGGPGMAASPDEMSQQERIKSELLIDLDKQIDTLKELKEIRKDNASYELERKAWKGFEEKPPFPVSFLDDIRDSLLSQRLALQSFELRLSLARTSFKRFDDSMKKSSKALRFADEESGRSLGTPREQRKRWLLDLARLQNSRNEAGLVLAELQRIACETAIDGKRSQIAFLEEKLRMAEASSPLSKEDLENILSGLDRQRTDLEAQLLAAKKGEIEANKELDAARNAMGSVSSVAGEKTKTKGPLKKIWQALGLSKAQERTVPRPEMPRLLRLDFEARQAFVETARLKVAALKGQIQFINTAEKIWQDRYWLTQIKDLKEVREKKEEVAEDFSRIGIVKKFANSNLASWMNLIKNQKDRIASLKKNDPELKIQELVLKTYEDRQDITLRLIEGLGRLERLAGRLNDELTHRIDRASMSSRFKEQLQSVYSFFKAVWDTELYVASETTVVDDRSIVRPVSVTIGKVVKALVLLVIGSLIAGRVGVVIQWFLTRRVKWPASKAAPAGKVMFGIMFLGVFVVSLIYVNIPLAVFTFLGGALAIGVGFGAQNIINNFISGLILLFDRSIRVGDVVEVDGQGGRVKEIGMRNSSIRRFDGIDILVPNSQFLQQKVTNWTLSDRQIRYSVSVGVAYGSSTRETTRVITQAIESHPMVLKAPPPTILFEEFGDSALLFTGYFWMELISNRDNRIAVSEVRHTISEFLEKAGIVISFPQRDIHLDSSKPLEVKVSYPEEAGKKTSDRQ